MSQPLERIVIDPPTPARTAVVWLHGLGADGHDFEPVVPALGLDPALATRFVFPHAPVRRVTVNAGMAMRAWYDIVSFEESDEDLAGIRASEAAVAALLREQVAGGIPAERIVLAGFSQGGALALRAGLCYPERLAGIVGLSCYAAVARQTAADAHPANRATSIFMAHGSLDPVVPLQMGQDSREWLERLGYEVTWRTYPIGHQVSPREIADIGGFLNRALKMGF